MYAFARQFAIRRRLAPAARLLGAAGACAMLCGCVGNPFADAKVDPSSPVASEVARVERMNRAYPRFSDIPAKPKDLRPVGQYARQAQVLTQARADLVAKTEPDTWSLNGTESFADQAKASAAAGGADASSVADGPGRRATPPPPPAPK
jgi:hypothetical protein